MYSAPTTFDEPPPPPRRRRSRINWPVTLAVVVLAGLVAATFLRPGTVSERDRDDKIVRVVLPPPPVPPPPPEVQPEEAPPEPTPTPLDQVLDTPPPPDAPSEPTAGDSALTARVGAGPSNYGLRAGDGGGTRIGGRPGGGGTANYGAYGAAVRSAMQRRLQGDARLRSAEFGGGVNVWITADGRVERLALAQSTGDTALDAAIVRALTGAVIGQPPPSGMPQPVRLRIGARSGR